MIDNFDLVRDKILDFRSNDDYYFVELIQRRKDFPEGSDVKSQTCVGTFMIKNQAQFCALEMEIKERCRMHNACAYINPSRKSLKRTTVLLAEQLFGMIVQGDCHKLNSRLESAAGLCKPERDAKLFVVDLDTKDNNVFQKVQNILAMRATVEAVVPTINGFHFITAPFNCMDFHAECLKAKIDPVPEIKHNSPTLLFYDGSYADQWLFDDGKTCLKVKDGAKAEFSLHVENGGRLVTVLLNDVELDYERPGKDGTCPVGDWWPYWLHEECMECIGFLWRTYALAQDSELAPGAIALKRMLLDTFEEVNDGAI